MAADSTSEEEVRRLERHYSVNPDGLVFARLADAYRRTGRLEEALDLLRDGLERHPDYTTGHLIAGRTLRAADRPAEAAESFRRVLELDAQNLVALRSLAEIATERGDVDEARRWAERLQRADPFASFSLAEARHEAARSRPAGESAGGEPPGGGEDAPPAEAGPPTGDAEDVPPADGGAPLPGEEDLAHEIAAMADDQWWSSAPESGGAEEDGAEVATETMAHLYAQQGLHEEAARVYRRLLERRPGDEELEARLEEMERRAAAGAPGDGDGDGRAEPEQPAPEPTARPAEASGPGTEDRSGTAPRDREAVTAREHFRALLRGDAGRPGDDPTPGRRAEARDGETAGAAGGGDR